MSATITNPRVSGVIVTKIGTVAKGLKVTAIDKNIDKDIVLGEAITDGSGNYVISYTKDSFQKSGKQKPDIEIKVTATANQQVYGISPVYFNSDPDETINLVLDTKSVDQSPEYDQILSDLTQYVKENQLGNLQENKDNQDISYLANKTGWDARLVAMVVLANKYSIESGILASLYYALFRAGMSTDPNVLYATNSDIVSNVWQQAIDEKLIAISLKGVLQNNLSKFQEARRTQLLDKATAGDISSFKDLLNISLPDISKQKDFVDLYFNNVDNMDAFWSSTEKKFGKNTSDQLQLDGKINYLTLNNAQLVKKIRNGKYVQGNSTDLIKNGFYKKEKWIEVLTNDVPVPPGIPGKDDNEKKANYAEYMSAMLKISYPSLVIAEMVNNKELVTKAVTPDSVGKEIYDFFQKMGDTFDLGTQPIGKVIEGNKINFTQKETIKELKRLQRVYQISPSDEAMKILYNRGLDSALAVVQCGQNEFVEQYRSDLGEDTAKLVYAKAQQVHSTVLNLATSYLRGKTSPALYAITGQSATK